MATLIHLDVAGVHALIEFAPDAIPSIVSWGASLGDVSEEEARSLALAARRAIVDNTPAAPRPVAIIPEQRHGWRGRPGLVGHRGGRDWSPAWRLEHVRVDGEPVEGFLTTGACVVECALVAEDSGLRLELTLEALPTGLLRTRAALTNTGADDFQLDELTLRYPVPGAARELFDYAGHWGAERTPQHTRLTAGAYRREHRRGRTGADASWILTASEARPRHREGELWSTHVAWSGNHVALAEADDSGVTLLGGGESLLAGEGRLAPGARYVSPWVVANHAIGLDGQAARFHEHLRALPVHPTSPRPVSLNVWEAVYFNHDAARLLDLAERAAAIGVERLVLDDGWFGARRDDTAGLGDWVVSPDVWPEGLHPLVNRVRELGMQFGLWVEPEMINLDSDLARAHPDWILRLPDRLPVESRHQYVLDLAVEGAYQHVLGQLSTVFEEYRVDAVKWDHNRDLLDAGHGPDGVPGVAAQTRAVYRLMDELRERFPAIEFESCSSGGARIDLEVMERASRVWVSDNIDPQDRQSMLWWTSQLLPPELQGSHVASGRSHVTGRWHSLDFRAATAVFGHFGIEWDLAEASPDELEALRWWISWYREHRETLHGGTLVRREFPDAGSWWKGVVTADRAIYSYAVVDQPARWSPGRLRFEGLDPDARYRLGRVERPALPNAANQPPWTREDSLELSGAQLAAVGIEAPMLHPNQAVLFVLDRLH